MPSLMDIPHLSHLVGLANPQMSTLLHCRGPCSWADEPGVPAANGAIGLVASCWLTGQEIGLCTCELDVFLFPGTCGANFLPCKYNGFSNCRLWCASCPIASLSRLLPLNRIQCNCCLCEKWKLQLQHCFQLWRPRGHNVFTLINSAMNSYNFPSNDNNNPIHVSLTFPLGIDFSAGDMVECAHVWKTSST